MVLPIASTLDVLRERPIPERFVKVLSRTTKRSDGRLKELDNNSPLLAPVTLLLLKTVRAPRRSTLVDPPVMTLEVTTASGDWRKILVLLETVVKLLPRIVGRSLVTSKLIPKLVLATSMLLLRVKLSLSEVLLAKIPCDPPRSVNRSNVTLSALVS